MDLHYEWYLKIVPKTARAIGTIFKYDMITKYYRYKFYDILTLLTSTEKLLTREGFRLGTAILNFVMIVNLVPRAFSPFSLIAVECN